MHGRGPGSTALPAFGWIGDDAADGFFPSLIPLAARVPIPLTPAAPAPDPPAG
jgi:hypothetical protein